MSVTRVFYKVHRWMAVAIGMFLFAWILSGIVMLIPAPVFLNLGLQKQSSQPSISSAPGFRDVTQSPSQAIAALEHALGRPVSVISVAFRQIRDRILYEITLKDGGPHLVDARSGELFTLSQNMAQEIALASYNGQGKLVQSGIMATHNYYYRGPLPAYRFFFEDSQRTVIYVNPLTGAVQESTRLGRIRRWITSLHEFEPLAFVIESERIRVGLMIVISLVALGVVSTGYFLAMPKGLRR